MDRLLARGSGFGKDLAGKYPNLSQCQHYWLMKCASELSPGRDLPEGSYARIKRLFTFALEQGNLLAPAIRIKTPEGVLRFYVYNDCLWVKCGETRLGEIQEDDVFVGLISDRQLLLLVTLCLDPITAASLWGKTIGSCCFCGRELTDERSTSMGYGPICAERWGLPWGDVTGACEVFPSVVD